MHRVLGLSWMSQRAQRLAEQRLQIHLAGVDDVENPARAAKFGGVSFTLARGRGPQRPAVLLLGKPVIPEITPEQAELPELVSDVFADVGDNTVRADDDLFP